MSDLLLYKASAGSGKTYQLTWNYLLMLYREPAAYKNILAVTFTNKAAGEMKARIMESLYLLASGDRSVEGYRQELHKETGKSMQEIDRVAREILTMILNDYSAFHVSTIDKFFQMVIRGFIREIGLQSGYNLELNSDRLLSEAVDRLMADIDQSRWLRSWLVKFADERIFAGKQWDPNKDIFRLGTEVFKEEYRELFDPVDLDDDFETRLSAYSGQLSSVIESMNNHLKKIGREALDDMDRAGVGIEDFAYKEKGVAGYIARLAGEGVVAPGVRALNAMDDPSKWCGANSPAKDVIDTLVSHSLESKLRHAISYYNENIERYNTANAIYRNIYAFGILNHISQKIKEIASEKNIFLLSDATYFLKKIIEGNPTPFVYEKAGNYFSHFMLDEFQDTSGFQWENFAPLIDNALAQGRSNLIVGDVKQSIYRWRNSDWMILAREVENHFNRFGVQVEPLNQNWRSAENIVRFNNTLFANAATTISAMVKRDAESAGAAPEFGDGWSELVGSIYNDALQSVPGKFLGTGGFVTARFVEAASNDAYTAWLKEHLPPIIKGLQDRGFAAGDITILVRKGSEGREIASMLLSESGNHDPKYNFNVISNDSLYLAGNPAVNFLVAMLNFLKNPSDPVNISFIRHEYMRYLADEPDAITDLNLLFSNIRETPGFHRVFSRFYEEYEKVRFMPLYELSEQLIQIFELNHDEKNLPYIQAFQDIILDFVRNETPDISAFLDHWEKNGSSATLSISEAQDAIRIMTIHKSKGLQFKAVIIPFCHWALPPEVSGTKDLILWVKTAGTGFGEMGHVPVKYHQDLVDSAFKEDYLNEKFHAYIDNLNLLYVAFTRAEEELHVLSRRSRSGNGPGHTGNLLYEILETGRPTDASFPGMDPDKYLDREKLTFYYGEPRTNTEMSSIGEDHDEGLKTVFMDSYPVSRMDGKLGLNVKNAFLSDLQEDAGMPLGYGTVMHEILAAIVTVEDMEISVTKAFNAGKIDRRQREDILSLLKKRLNDEMIARWFSHNAMVRTEQELVKAGRGILRPDRVVYLDDHVEVVDYKFGLNPEPAHQHQVRKYMEALGEIENIPVKGFLWYVTTGRIEEVEK